MLSTLFTRFIHWVLPVSCVLCGKVGIGSSPNICEACAHDLPAIVQPCQQCGLPLPNASILCGQCLQHPPAYNRLHALWSYQFPMDQLILQLKFQRKLLYAHLLGELIAKRSACYYTTGVPRPSILIPVPLHARRLRERGFNQSVEIARPISRRLGIPIEYNAIKRIKYTQPQMDLPLALREQNIQNAFSVRNISLPKHVGIVDDVVTSGHTIHSLCLILRAAGVQHIDVWCAARALR